MPRPIKPGAAKRRAHPWRSEYPRDFGVRVIETDAETGEVLVAECCFCAVFGREEKVVRAVPSPPQQQGDHEETAAQTDAPPKKTRARTRNVATWKQPFRSDNMRSHHIEQHPRKWTEYCTLLTQVKKEQTLHGLTVAAESAVFAQLKEFFGGDDPANARVGGADSATKTEGSANAAVASSPATRLKRERAALDAAVGHRRTVRRSIGSGNSASGGVASLALEFAERPTRSIVDAIASRLAYAGPEASNKTSDDTADAAGGASLQPTTTRSAAPVQDEDATAATMRLIAMIDSLASSRSEQKQFALVQDLLRTDLTLSQVAQTVEIARSYCEDQEQSPPATLAQVGDYARLAIAVDLQRIANMMHQSWAYALELRVAGAGDNTLVDLCLRLPVAYGSVEIDSVHLSRLPMHQDTLPVLLEIVMHALDPKWKHKVLGGIAYGPVGCLQVPHNVLKKIPENAGITPFYRVWRSELHVETSLLRALGELTGNDFMVVLQAVWAFLRDSLPPTWTQTHGQSPRFVESDPASLLQLLQWLVARREAITAQYDAAISSGDQCADCAAHHRPTSGFWLIALVLVDLLTTATAVAHKLQQETPRSIAEAHQIMFDFMKKLAERFVIAVVFDSSGEVAGAAESNATFKFSDSAMTLGSFQWERGQVVAFLRSLNVSTRRMYSELSVEQQAMVQDVIARVMLRFLVSITTDDLALDASNLLQTQAPPTLPLQFIALDRTAAVDLIEQHCARLESMYDVAFMDSITSNIQDLRALVTSDPSLLATLEAAQAKSFSAAWQPVENFHSLRTFASGLATVLQSSSGSKHLLEKRESQTPRVGDLEQEAHLHARQMSRVREAHNSFTLASTPENVVLV